MIELYRWYHDDCTIGRLCFEDFQCFTLELPDLNNQRNISCIPEGVYNCHIFNSQKNGKVISIEDVPGRSYIQIHSGNFTSQIEGCILVGDSIKRLNADNIPDVTNSKKTLSELLAIVPMKTKISIY